FGTQAAAKQFISQGGGGLILNISSVHEDWPMPGNIAYCVSKGGMRMLTRTAGVELGQHGIRVVNVAPGAVDTFGRLDVLVNNAGMETRTSLLDTTPEQYDTVMAVNLRSAFFASQLAAKRFIQQGDGGIIINISSVHEDWPMPGNTPYCVSKGGMRMLARTAGVELGPHGIRMVNVAPGAVETPINQQTMQDPAQLKKLDDAIPMRRMAKPEEIADVVVFLASGKADYMTSTTVVVDGGIMQGSVGL
ncbi:MAG: glucose 1-dehydrogenase, partial [Microbacteriaceae bacterium]|nr:glucose 1-dehydrogenase [Microbacteriaceae bacterium]